MENKEADLSFSPSFRKKGQGRSLPIPPPEKNSESRWRRRFLPTLLFAFALASSARADRPPLIRIGLRASAPSVVLGAGAYFLTGSVPRREVKYRQPQEILPAKTGFFVGKERWGNKITIEPADPEGVVTVNKRPFRGAIELDRRGAGIRVVNRLSVEDYVRGVLLMETSDQWPVEALKAQSVISRTYALRNRGRHGSSGYDFCPSPHCQTYAGASAERKTTDAAVKRTRGEVLVDRKKKLISAVYHSCCGGSTESAENVWEHGGQPYLKVVRCGWCRSSPRFHWMARVPYALVDQRLASAGYHIGAVRAIGILSHTPSGRVYQVRIFGERGTRDLLANTFRNIVNPALIRSTLWAGVSKLDGAWQIHGSGWGHGVGLCQWGMKTLADNSMTYGQILRIYYHRVEVVDWTE
ncbi:MAG: SpoIID/LytB domain-containing protein [Elusimicrobia bacterium]|nr:SpoIID/LytB domain-containing protein [Elusimicrobiota bacterium]